MLNMIALFLAPMMSVHLNKLMFYSYHGVHEEERIVGGNFEVNITVRYLPLATVVHELENTINYATLYEIVKQRMAVATPLLETIVMELAETFLAQFSMITGVDISLTKLQAPIASFTGLVGVSYTKTRN